MNSYSVRCIIEWPLKSRPSGPATKLKHLYEERITAWKAVDMDEAIEKAEVEVLAYCDKHGFIYTELSQVYWMVTPIDADGIELYSLLRESDLDSNDYLDAFFDTGAERAAEYLA